MWRTANPHKVAATRGYGAEVDLEAENAGRVATTGCSSTSRRTGAIFVHPFDDPVLQSGHGTLGLEIAEDVPGADVVVVPVGGGGPDRRSWPKGALGCTRRRCRAGRRARRCSAALAGREPVPVHAAIGRRRPRRALHRRALPGGRARARRRGRARLRGGDRGGVPLPLHPREARLRARRRRLDGGSPGRENRPGTGRNAWSLSSQEATRRPKPPLLSWLGDEGRHPPGLHARDRALRMRQRVPDALDEARAARRDLLGLPSVLHR